MAWLRDARMEHASVTSFLRAALELRGVGAPATLVDACARAAHDERRHAAMCLDLAQRLSGRALQLGPLPEPVARPGGLAAVLCRTFTEGCVAETIAAHLAACAAARTDDPRIRSVLTQIADDEADHAALAWTTLGWGLPRLPAAAREAFFAWARARTPRGESAGRASVPTS
jgi:demethoxyubiquinone hydroxylase (CLK1/Coq7/Cat5 family)